MDGSISLWAASDLMLRSCSQFPESEASLWPVRALGRYHESLQSGWQQVHQQSGAFEQSQQGQGSTHFKQGRKNRIAEAKHAQGQSASWSRVPREMNLEKTWEQRLYPMVYALGLKQAKKLKDPKPSLLRVNYLSQLKLFPSASRRGSYWCLEGVVIPDLHLSFENRMGLT